MNWKKRLALATFLGFLVTSLTLGSERWTQTLPGGLECRALVVDPKNTSNLYAGTIGGGVFKSTDMGVNWRAINNSLNDTDVRTLVLDSDASTLYAGTLEGVFKSDMGATFKSTDMGATWAAINNGRPILVSLPWLSIPPALPPFMPEPSAEGRSRARTWEPTGRRSIMA